MPLFDPGRRQTSFSTRPSIIERALETEPDGLSAELNEDWQIQLPRTRMLLRYKDGSGNITDSAIEIVRLYGTDVRGAPLPTRIFAFCHLRREMRSFRLDRITYAADGDTGELIKSVKAWLRDRGARI
jgi:hypothetical protein